MTADELKTKRIAANLTQQELAAKVGWTGSNPGQRVYDYESKRRQMTPAVQKLFTLILA